MTGDRSREPVAPRRRRGCRDSGCRPSRGCGHPALPAAAPEWRFVFVNHALTNPFFVPAKYGSADAAGLLGARIEWTGSTSSDVGEMVKAMQRAIEEQVGGIAVSLIDPEAFNGPTELALKRGIPVVSYNADGGKANARLAYIGQDNYQSGLELGARIVSLVSSGEVCLFIATPGQENIQPRVDGALDAIRDSGKQIGVQVVASGVDVGAERTKIEETYPRPPHAARALRRRRRLDSRGRRRHARAQAQRQGRPGRRIRPSARDPAGDLRPRPRLLDRPAALPAGFPARAAALSPPLQRRPRRPCGHEHRPQLRHARERRAVPDDGEPLRGKLEPGGVPGFIRNSGGYPRLALLL